MTTSYKASLRGVEMVRSGAGQFLATEIKTDLLAPITGKRVYRKAIEITALPDTTSGTFAHGIADLDVTDGAYLRIDGTVVSGTIAEHIALAANVSVVSVDATNINITTGADLSGSTAIVLLEYTKTS